MDIPMVMIAHAAYPLLDLQETDRNGKLLPSSLSFNVVTNLLRQDMEFAGLAVTDDLEMGAIVRNYGIGEACKMAINAGQDMLAVCADPTAIREGFNAVSEAVESGDIPMQRLEDSLERTARIKTQLEQPLPFDPGRLKTLSNEIAELGSHLN
jgi:beta-N-acetylhexosaminidase